jgi:hypothetical protein
VRDLKVLFAYYRVAEEEYVYVEGTLPPPPFTAPVPAVSGLDCVYLFKQFSGSPLVKAPHGGIEKGRLILDIKRLRFPDGGLPQIPKDGL